MLELRNIHISYGQTDIFTDLNLTFNAASINGILGLNGAGKSTLFNAISGIKKAHKGAFHWLGNTLEQTDIAYLPSENFFYPGLTGMDYLRIFESNVDQINKRNQLFDLPLDHFIDSYSLGMKKKLALLGVISLDSGIYIFDEPYNGLDVEACLILSKLLVALKEKKKTVLVSSHIIDPLKEIADSIYFIDEKRSIQQFSKEEYNVLSEDILPEKVKSKTDLIDGLI